MNRDEILAAARENGIKNEEYERQTLLRGDNVSAIIGVSLGVILFVTELIVRKKLNIGLMTVLFTMSGIQFIYEGIKLHKRICVIIGIYIAIMAVLSLLLFIGDIALA